MARRIDLLMGMDPFANVFLSRPVGQGNNILGRRFILHTLGGIKGFPEHRISDILGNLSSYPQAL